MGGQIQALGKVDGAAWRGPRLFPSLATALWLLLVGACLLPRRLDSGRRCWREEVPHI